MKRVVVTGGAGFIGVNLLRHLQENGSRPLVVLDDFSVGSPERLSGLDVEIVEASILERDALTRTFKGADAVIHLAARGGVVESVDDPQATFDTNVAGTFGVLDAARRAGVGTVVLASTGGAIAGDGAPLPFAETSAARPVSPYGASKLCAEAFAGAYAGSYGMRAIAVRFANVYGPHCQTKQSAIARFLRAIRDGERLTVFGDGEQARDFVHVDDICTGIARAMELGKAGGVYNLGSGVSTSINEVLGHMRAIVSPGHAVQVDYSSARAGEVRTTWLDISHAREALAFTPEIDIRTGLETTWNWTLREAKPNR